MKLFLFLLFQITTLCSNEAWIPIDSLDQTKKASTKLDLDLSEIEPVKKMLKNVKVVKQLVDLSNKKEISTPNEKNWFIINSKKNSTLLKEE